MEKIDINDLELLSHFNYGSNSEIYRCKFNDFEFIYKEYNDSNDFLTCDFIDKIDLIKSIKLEFSKLPILLVCDKEKPKGFLLKELEDIDYSFSNVSTKINVLKKAKEAILELHKNNVIHGDIHISNVILSNKEINLIDFDNSSYKEFIPKKDWYSDNAIKFINKYGLNKDLDIYLFNLLTFSLLNKEFYFPTMLYKIGCSCYGVFDNKEAIKICRSLLLEDKVFNNGFLIDFVDEQNCKKLLK